MDSDHPVVLITGASSGIGKATARLFAEEGFRVFGTSRRERSDEQGLTMLTLDVRDDESVHRCVDEVLERAGQIDVLVNNAGILHVGFAEETTLDDARAVFETNFFGVVRVTDAVLPTMRRRRQGRIINVGSLAGWVAPPGESFYAASKHALAGYSEALRQEVAPLGLSVSLVEPGFFQTSIYQAATEAEHRISDYDTTRRAALSRLDASARRAPDPHVVGRRILKVARAGNPRLRYGAGRDGRWVPLLKTLLPQRLFEGALRWHFGLLGQSDAGRRPQDT